eukprot:1064371-Rhodomonas_salina.2
MLDARCPMPERVTHVVRLRVRARAPSLARRLPQSAISTLHSSFSLCVWLTRRWREQDRADRGAQHAAGARGSQGLRAHERGPPRASANPAVAVSASCCLRLQCCCLWWHVVVFAAQLFKNLDKLCARCGRYVTLEQLAIVLGP